MPITNGKQIKTGSCNPAPMGAIPSTDKMPASKFVNPKNGATLPANTNFTIQLAIRNIETGHFTNAQQNYLAAPQQLNAQGVIQGHSHVVIEKLNSLDQTTPTDPNTFAFFKGLNDPAVNGVLSVEVGGGLPEGVYRIASINAAMNHQPALVAVAQHGSLDDMAYFTVTAGGAGAGAGAAAGAGAGAGAAAGAAAGAGAAKGGNAAAAGAAAGAAGAKAKPAQGKGAGAAKGAAAGKGAGAAKGAAAGKGFGGRFSAKGQGKSRF
ncbi:hypothetical protein C8Q77DRAFT_1183489 [Trametes polyzona]|nr:hypothetical protein C8Q77DRAFT_1183489 [Trametes polyzona]